MNPPRKSQNGSALLAVLFFMVLTSLTVAMVYSVTNSHVMASKRMVDRSIALAYADGVMESLFDQWRIQLTSVTNATDRTNGMSTTAINAALTPPSATTLPPPTNVSLSSWSLTALTPLLATTTDPAGRPTLENGTNSRLRVRIYYRAKVTVQYHAATGSKTATVQRVFCRAGRNIFDNFFFGTQSNVEFHPGPDMYVNGTVYVGGNLYTATDALHFMQDVTFTGSQTLDYRTNDPRYGSTAPNIASDGLADNWSLSNPPHVGAQQKLLDVPMTSLDPNFLDDSISNDVDSDGNPNNNGYHEIIEEVTDKTKTDPLQLDASDSERLSTNADYRIYVNSANTVTVYSGASTTALSTSSSEYKAINGAITTNTAMTDDREGDNVRMVTVDVSQITAAASAGKIKDSVGSSDGYLLYITDNSVGTKVTTNIVDSSTGKKTSVTSNGARAVKLVNGATLPSQGLSVVSPNPVYIQGDYNTGSTSSTQPASNTASSYTPPSDTPSPVVGTYNRAPAAVVGDAINILSNNWNDANSPSDMSSRVATSTTVNTALVAGNVPTTSSSYSGGIENFTRFHEDWSSAYFTIYGALAQLYDSEQAKGTWANSSYNPPNRRWYFDDNLQNNNPPGFSVAHVYARGDRTQY
jgi:Tfp pilus assembly protein PilX